MSLESNIISLIKKIKSRLKYEDDNSGREYSLDADHIQISFEYDSELKEWLAIPLCEQGGDGCPSYLCSEYSDWDVLLGSGKSVNLALLNLSKIITKSKKIYCY